MVQNKIIAYDILKALCAENENHVVTSRRQLLRDHTQQWIDRHFPGVFSGVHYSGTFDTFQYGVFGDYKWNQADNLPKLVTRCKNWHEVGEYFGVSR